MTSFTSDAGIPLLTEIIPGPAPAQSGRAPAAPSAAAPARKDMTTTPAHGSASLQDAEWQRLESEIRERVLHQILERIDFVLEQRVRDSLADVLQTAVEGLASEIKGGLQASIRDVVARAVNNEIAKLKSEKK